MFRVWFIALNFQQNSPKLYPTVLVFEKVGSMSLCGNQQTNGDMCYPSKQINKVGYTDDVIKYWFLHIIILYRPRIWTMKSANIGFYNYWMYLAI